MFVVTLLLFAQAASPIQKVVDLITDLESKVRTDGKTEQAVYDKYACWCEETMNRKSGAISAAKASIEDLSTKIKEAKGRLGSFGAEIAKLKKDIAANKEFTAKSDEIRSKEKAAFTKQKAALEQGIANLKKAVEVLSTGTTHDKPAMLETKLLSVAAGVRSAMRFYAKRDSFDSDDLATVKSFLGNPVSLVAERANPATGTYNTQSGAIQGILAQMLDDFNSELGTSTTEENTAQTTYKEMKKNKASELEMLSDTLVKKNSANGRDARSLAENQQERKETQEQLKLDEEFLETTTDNCRKEADAWATRSRLRTEELAGMQDAVSILTGGADTFASSETTFVQLGSHMAERAKAYNTIKAAATATHSLRLAVVASRVYMGGHFDKVIESVQKQIESLRKEEKADEDHKHWCETERNNALAKKENLANDQSDLQNKMNRLASTKADHEASILQLEGEMKDLKKAMKEALENRNAENEAFKQAMKDDTDAVMLISKAIEALSRFYENNNIGLSQKKVHHKHREPEYAANEDTAPTAVSAGGDYGGRSSENTGIVNILENIKEDTNNEMQVARKEEQEAADAYRAQTEESRKSMKAMEDKVTTLNQRIAETVKASADAQEVHDGKQKTIDATNDYLEELKPSCDWIMAQYESRREKRKTEIQGLQDAKGALAGAAPGLIATRSRGSKRSQVDSDLKDLDDIERSISFLQRRH